MNPDEYVDIRLKNLFSMFGDQIRKIDNIKNETDEEKLEKMDIKTIENFLRKKKLKNIIK